MTNFQIIGGKDRINYAINSSFELYLADAGNFQPAGWENTGGLKVIQNPVLFDSVPFIGRSGTNVLGANNPANTIETAVLKLYNLPPDKIIYVSVRAMNSPYTAAKLGLTNGFYAPLSAELAISGAYDTGLLQLAMPANGSGELTITLTLQAIPGNSLQGFFDCVYAGIREGDYFDGDSIGAIWQGMPHLSPSLLPSTSLYSGKTLDLRDEGFIINSVNGFGDTEIEPRIEEDGNTNILIADVNIKARKLVLITTVAENMRETFYTQRAKLLEVLFPRNKSAARILRYIPDNAPPMDIAAWYTGGLNAPSMGGSNIERVALQFLCPDPYPYASVASSYTIDCEDNITAKGVLKIIDNALPGTDQGLQNYAKSGLPAPVTLLQMMKNNVAVAIINDVFMGANRSQIYIDNGVGNTWRLVATTAGHIYAVSALDNDRLVLGGEFTSITATGAGASAIGKLITVKITPVSTNTENMIGYGHIYTVRAIFVGVGGAIYFAGDGFVPLGQYIRKLVISVAYTLISIADITSFSTISGKILSIITIGNTLYYVGSFVHTTPSLSYGAKCSPFEYSLGVAQITTALGVLPTGATKIERGENNEYYVLSAGSTNAYLYKGTPNGLESLIAYNTEQITDIHYSYAKHALIIIGKSLNPMVFAGRLLPSNILYDILYYTNGIISVYPLIIPLDNPSLISSHNGMIVFAIASLTDREVVAAGQKDYEVAGNAPSQPYFVISGAGVVHSIENTTTGQRIDLDFPITRNDTITIDTRKLSLGIRSSQLGDISYLLPPQSNLQNFYLIPGINNLRVWVYRDNTPLTLNATVPQCTMYYHATYLSFDGASGGLTEV